MSTTQSLLQRKSVSGKRTALAYGSMLVVAAAIFAAIRSRGEHLVAPEVPGAGAVHAAAAHSNALAQVLLAIATIVMCARFAGLVFDRFLKQPPVMGEIIAGIALGPSVLGALSPEIYNFVLAPEAAPHLAIVAKIGVVLFMFLVGLELDLGLLKGTTHTTMAISHASIVMPFLLGAGTALVLYPIYSHSGVSFTVFCLFLGVSMSVTAFPVLARILTDRRLQRTPIGATALACAAVDDATAWCLLAFVSGVASAQIDKPLMTVGLVAAYMLFVYVAVRPFLKWIAAKDDTHTRPVSLNKLACVFGLLLLSAVATEAIGIHALFGAFAFGVFIPHESRLAEQLRARLDDVVGVLLLPIFFAFTGMRTQIGLMGSAQDWLLCGLVIAVATVGKFGGTFIAARFTGLSGRESSALGILMNTRGLMELIVLNVGLDMGVLSPRLFAMFIIMALVTTFSTTPILNLIMRGQSFATVPPASDADGTRTHA